MRHLGRWNSSIPNTRGIPQRRRRCVQTDQSARIALAGRRCFADDDTVGRTASGAKATFDHPTHWGVVENNHFETARGFLDLCEQAGSNRVICAALAAHGAEVMGGLNT